MKRVVLAVLLFFMFVPAIAQAEEKILVINPDGHRGAINAMVIDKDGNIITGGNDKVVKIWDSKDGTLQHEIHGQVGPGTEGKIYQMALSTDNRFLAVSGWFAKSNATSGLGAIRIYDYASGKLLKLLKGHRNTLSALHFLPNTHHLFSLDYFGDMVRWNLDDFSQENLTTVGEDAVNFVLYNDFMVTAHASGHVHLWNISDLSKPADTYNTMQKGTAEDMCLAISPDGEQIAVSQHYHLYIFDRKMKMKYKLDQGEDYILSISYSPNSKRMIVVSGSNEIEKQLVQAYEKRENTWYYMSVFKKHTMSADCSVFLTDDICVTADQEIAIWKPETKKKNSTLIHWIESPGTFFTSVGMKDDQISFGTIYKKRYGFSPFQFVFDLTDRSIQPYDSTYNFNFPVLNHGGLELEIAPSQSLLFVRNERSLLATIERESGHGSTHEAVTLVNDEYVVSGGGNGVLQVFYTDGHKASELVGHESDISGLAVSPDGKFLVSSSVDQTIRIWSVAEFGKSTAVLPLLSLFITKDHEWVLWNKDGYFASSKKGASYIGFHINQGEDEVAKYYPFEQFDIQYNRPDIIMGCLGFIDPAIIDLYHSAYLKRLKRMNIRETDLTAEMNVPVVMIQSKPVLDQKISVTVIATDSLHELKSLNVFINEVPVYGRNGIALSERHIKKLEETISLTLMSGINKVQVSVTNSAGVESMKETIKVNNPSVEQGELFIVSIGVSKYKDAAYNLDFAAKDAEDVSALFSSSTIFEKVNQKLLTNEMVTRSALIEVKNFLAAANSNDVVILFVAGHGVLNKTLDYYYCTHDMDFLAPEKAGITYAELEVLFDGIRAIRKLLIMDTCHSGEVDKDDLEEIAFVDSENPDISFRSGNTSTTVREVQGLEKTNEAVKEMFNDLRRGTGATVISSAGGAEYAMESDEWQNGLFTYCLLEGITTKNADTDKNGQVMLSELQNYISVKVAELSKGRQMPTSRFENLALDYRVW